MPKSCDIAIIFHIFISSFFLSHSLTASASPYAEHSGYPLAKQTYIGMILELFIKSLSLTVENTLIFFAVEKKPRHDR